MKVKMFFLIFLIVDNEKKNSEIKNKGPRDFVNKTWLEEKKNKKILY